MKQPIYLVIMTCLLIGVLAPLQSTHAEVRTTSTWLWNSYEIVYNSDEILRFLEEKRVSDLYLQINRDIPIGYYQAFIEKANKRKIKVYALDGAPTWAAKKGNREYEPILNWLRNYQAQSAPYQHFKGIHLDVEPYLVAEWNTNRQKTIEYYQNALIRFQTLSRELKMTFSNDIPFWFDEVSYNSKAYGKGILSEWLISESDFVTIMAYRNKAEGPNGMIELVRNELNYAASKQKKVIIGVETMRSFEGAHISFFESGEDHMEHELTKVQNHYHTSSSYSGMAIHQYMSWRQLKKSR